jgi:curli biogenesis system outer membrane secretion channel CsgG
VVREDGETLLRKRRAQDVAQEAGAGLVVEGTCVGLGSIVKSMGVFERLGTLPDCIGATLIASTRRAGAGLAAVFWC